MKIKHLIALPMMAMTLFSCSSNGNFKAMDSEGTDTTLLEADTTGDMKLIKTADMNLQVADVNTMAVKVSKLTALYKGMVMNNHMQQQQLRSRMLRISADSVLKISSFVTTGNMTVRVPSASLNDFMAKAAGLGGLVLSRNLDIQDRTLDYLESNLKMNSRRELVKQQKQGRIEIKNAEDVLVFKDSFVDEQINRHRIDDAAAYSTFTLSFTQPQHIIKQHLADADPDNFTLPFTTRLKLGLKNGLDVAGAVAVALANLWVFALFGIIAWYVINKLVKLKWDTKATKPVVEAKA